MRKLPLLRSAALLMVIGGLSVSFFASSVNPSVYSAALQNANTPAVTIIPLATFPPTATFTPSLTPSPTPTTHPPTLTLTPSDNDQEVLLRAVPILSEPSERVREIFRAGQLAGNHANVITKVGGSNSTSTAFMSQFDVGEYNLGPYEYLQPTIDFFSGSFSQTSLAAQVGFNAFTVLDPIWADSARCYPNETPLACEYRRKKPSVALMMFSANDLIHLTPELYELALSQIVEISIDAGVIPVLITFVQRPDSRWDKMIEFHLIMEKVATTYEVPLINLWLAAQTLPNMGVGADNVHYTRSGILDFRGDQYVRGHTLWSFLSLQMLHNLRETIPMVLPPATPTPTPTATNAG